MRLAADLYLHTNMNVTRTGQVDRDTVYFQLLDAEQKQILFPGLEWRWRQNQMVVIAIVTARVGNRPNFHASVWY